MNKNTNIDFFRESISKERIINLDFSYLSNSIENWWESLADETPRYHAKFQLISLILESCKKEDIYYFDKLGMNHISAVSITNIFKIDSHKLSLLVHEALSELFGLNDIKYPYEEHKNLYLKPEGCNYRDWGNGYGEITPHSDDLYEDISTDFLSLTVCRDNTNTPTILYFPKDLLENFTNEELTRLLKLKAKFISGKNVEVLKSKIRNVIEFSYEKGFKFFLDFRIDTQVGERMLPINCEDRYLIDKLRANILTSKYTESISKTGTFTIAANYKVLHARAQMNIDHKLATEIANTNDYTLAPRLLYRSKGQDSRILNI